MPRYYNRQGEPISLNLWAELLEDDKYRRIAETKIGPFWISTVWLGLDHNWDVAGPPAIFETMVFDNSDRPFHDLECRRYSTEEQALMGHDNMVAVVASWEKEDRAEALLDQDWGDVWDSLEEVPDEH